MSAVAAVQTTTIHEDQFGIVRRVSCNGRTTYSASGYCIGNHRGDNFQYGVTITPPGVNASCWSGYDSEDQAREAITNWRPTWWDHARDHNHVLRKAGLPLKPMPSPADR